MFVGINMFWAQLTLILAQAATWGLKWVWEGPKNINSITINITLEGIEKIKTEKNDKKHSEEYFFHQRCEKMSTNFEVASRFWLAA